MEFTPALKRELASLTAYLGDPDTDIADSVHRLANDIRAAVDSYLGMTITAAHTDPPFAFTALDAGGGSVVTSLMLTMPIDGASHQPVSIVLYASTPGAFVDLAADLAWMVGPTPDAVILDEHLNPVPTSLRSSSAVNQAIGVLIGRGHTLHSAHRELDVQAARTGTDRAGAAEMLLSELNPRP